MQPIKNLDPGPNALSGSTDNGDASGVFGENDGSGNGVAGFSKDGIGVRGDSANGFAAVHGHGAKNGMWGFTISSTDSGVFGQNDGSGNGVSAFGGGNQGVGIFAQSSAKGSRGTNTIAGFFDGDVVVSGDVQLTGADCAENFDVSGTETILPGTVMVINTEGSLQPSDQAYDKKVAGVVSGAGDYRPAIVLDKQRSQASRLPVALMGKVCCKVDAQYGGIEVGDLLTTSATPGYAMKADDPFRAFGAVIGKALRPLKEGQGLIPILIALQ